MHRRVVFFGCIAVGLSWFSAGPTTAENPLLQSNDALVSPDLPAESVQELRQVTQQLASPEFAIRRSAFNHLWNAGRDALPIIRQAKSSTDRQVTEMANVLEILIELEIAPGRHEQTAKLFELLTSPSAQSILALAEMEYWSVAEQLLGRNADLQQKFQEPYGRYLLSRVVEAALEQGDPSLAWPIVRVAVPPQLSAWISHKTGLELSDNQSTDASVQALQHFFAGDISPALAGPAPAIVRLPMITRSGTWSRLLDPPIMQLLTGRQPTPAQQAVRAVLHEVAGDVETSDRLWNDLLGSTKVAPGERANTDTSPAAEEAAPVDEPPAPELEEQQDSPELQHQSDSQQRAALLILEALETSGIGGQTTQNQLLAALMFTGRVQAIEEYLLNKDPTAAYGFFLAGNNHARALEALGLQTDLSNLDAWLSERKSLISAEFGQRPPDIRHFDEAARLCGTLSGIGHQAEAEKILNELVQLARLSRGNQEELWGRHILGWLGRSEARLLALRAARDEFERMSSECQDAVLKGLYPELEGTAVALLKTAPGEDQQQRWDNLEKLWLWDRSHFGEAAQTMLAGWLRRAFAELQQEGAAAEDVSGLAKVAVGIGDTDLALELLTSDVGNSKDLSMINLQWRDAARIYLQRGAPDQALSLLGNLRRTGVNAQATYLDEIEALLMNGQYQQAERIDQARWLRPLATTRFYQGANYLQVARELLEEKQHTRAREYAEGAFLMAESGGMDLYWIASDYASILEELGEHQQAADVLRAALVEAMQPYASSMQYLIGNGYYSSLRFAAQKEKLARARACIATEDYTAARRNILIGLSLQPQDIEMVVQCYPPLIAAGETELAEELFTSYEQNMLQQISHWPHDATALNNLAWMYSQCDRKLEEAQQLAQQATALAPHSAIFLDTLAEVEFRSGLVEAASETMRECVRLDPREIHYRDNLVRFRARLRQPASP